MSKVGDLRKYGKSGRGLQEYGGGGAVKVWTCLKFDLLKLSSRQI